MIDYLAAHPDKLIGPLAEHLALTALVLVLSVALALLIVVAAQFFPALGSLCTRLFSLVYAIPSLALFALMIPFTGLGKVTASIVLVAYNQYLLLGNFLTGLNEVDPGIRESALGIGMKKMELLWIVQVPLAKKAIFAGIRLAAVSTVGIGTVAAAVNAGGLGTILFDGLRTVNPVKILWGSLLSALLALLLDALFKWLERKS